MSKPLDHDPQIDGLLAVVLELARQVRTDRMCGQFAVEFSAHKGEIKTAHQVAKIPKLMPLRSGKI